MSSMFENNVEPSDRIRKGSDIGGAPGLGSFNHDPENVQILLVVYLGCILKRKWLFRLL